ncbi:hypothetical protein ACIOTN_17120 [Glutamicibacter sp. NPDC087661]|uniref:hypothetical protein n=1 Tax=Glutamicibacter sp. NPDC087661 TaxID=3363996 RepID=UPI003821C106
MAPFVGRSGVVLNLAPLTSAGLVRNGTLVEIDDGLSAKDVASIVAERFGKKPAEETTAVVSSAVATGEVEEPRGNASREDWVEYAIAQGKTEDDLAGLKQTEIRALLKQESEKAELQGKSEEGSKSKEEEKSENTVPAGTSDASDSDNE